MVSSFLFLYLMLAAYFFHLNRFFESNYFFRYFNQLSLFLKVLQLVTSLYKVDLIINHQKDLVQDNQNRNCLIFSFPFLDLSIKKL